MLDEACQSLTNIDQMLTNSWPKATQCGRHVADGGDILAEVVQSWSILVQPLLNSADWCHLFGAKWPTPARLGPKSANLGRLPPKVDQHRPHADQLRSFWTKCWSMFGEHWCESLTDVVHIWSMRATFRSSVLPSLLGSTLGHKRGAQRFRAQDPQHGDRKVGPGEGSA